MEKIILNKNKKLLIFLDIDGTLIQSNQKPNSQKLPTIIKKLSKKGILFGLNSNRSFHDTKEIYRQFELNGPIFLENGVYFKKTENSKRIFLIKNLLKLKKISKQATKSFIEKHKINCNFFYGNTVKFIKSNKLKSIPLAILVNSFREYTGSVHIYKYGKRELLLAKKLTVFLKSYFKKNNLSLLVENPKAFGNIVFWPKGIDKGIALQKAKKYYRSYDFVMIGDDLADLETLKRTKYFFAVGNAQKEVKEKADFCSQETYTKGVIEILHLIDNSFDKK